MTQRKLFSGMDCLPGQRDLFATDGEPPGEDLPDDDHWPVDAYMTGRDAQKHGDKLADNPHCSIDEPLAFARWRFGWLDAHEAEFAT
jgi:hypothetical protein